MSKLFTYKYYPQSAYNHKIKLHGSFTNYNDKYFETSSEAVLSDA